MGLNLYLYCFNNPISYYDSNGHFFREIGRKIANTAQKAWNGITRAATSVKNAITNAYNQVKNTFQNIKNSFTMDVGVGIGAGSRKGLKIGNTGLTGKGEAYKDMGVTYTPNTGFKSQTSFSVGNTLNAGNHEVGLAYSFTHYDDGLESFGELHDNPMAIRSNIFCENTEHSFVPGYKYMGIAEGSTTFIGIDFSSHFVIGGHIKIGFNI